MVGKQFKVHDPEKGGGSPRFYDGMLGRCCWCGVPSTVWYFRLWLICHFFSCAFARNTMKTVFSAFKEFFPSTTNLNQTIFITQRKRKQSNTTKYKKCTNTSSIDYPPTTTTTAHLSPHHHHTFLVHHSSQQQHFPIYNKNNNNNTFPIPQLHHYHNRVRTLVPPGASSRIRPRVASLVARAETASPLFVGKNLWTVADLTAEMAVAEVPSTFKCFPT